MGHRKKLKVINRGKGIVRKKIWVDCWGERYLKLGRMCNKNAVYM